MPPNNNQPSQPNMPQTGIQQGVGLTPQTQVLNTGPIMPSPQALTSDPPKGGSSKMVFLAVAIVLILVVVGGGVYYYITSQQPSTTETKSTPNVTTTDLQSEVDANQLTEVDPEFSEVDQDLKDL